VFLGSQLRCRLLGTIALSIFQFFSLKKVRSRSIVTPVTRQASEHVKNLRMGNSRKKWVFNLAFFANISEFHIHSFVWLDGAYIWVQKIGVLAENFPLGGAKRFHRRYVWKFFFSSKKSTACRKLCHFVEHVVAFKISKICNVFLTRKNGFII